VVGEIDRGDEAPMESKIRRRAATFAVATGMWVFALALPATVRADPAWIRGEIRLNLRTGPGNNYRIVGSLGTGDKVDVVQRTEKWTQIRLEDGQDGWIPAGYLQDEAPPAIRLGDLEEEVVELRGQLETITAEREALAEKNASLAGNDDEQLQQIAELTRENARLKGGQRWPEWITGAGVLCVGMLLGAAWSRSTGRRSSPRIRL
jgi:SH3 domain protein